MAKLSATRTTPVCKTGVRPYAYYLLVACLLLAIGQSWSPPLRADEAVAKQVHLIVKNRRLIASNILTSRFDEFRLKPREEIADRAVGNAAIVVVTNKRIIAYGAPSGWRSRNTQVNEVVEQVSVQDFAVLVVTNKRLLNFNGQTGLWGQSDIPISSR